MFHGQEFQIYDVSPGIWIPESVINRTFRVIESQFKQDGDEVPTLLYAIWTDVVTQCQLVLPPECVAYFQQEVGLKGE